MHMTFLTFQACTATTVWGVIFLMVAAKISSLTVGYTLLDIIREAGRILSGFLSAEQGLQLCNTTQISSLLICKQGVLEEEELKGFPLKALVSAV